MEPESSSTPVVDVNTPADPSDIEAAADGGNLTQDEAVALKKIDAEAAKKRPKPKPKGPKYEGPTLGRIVHVIVNRALASALNCEEGLEAAAIVTSVREETGAFGVTVFAPTTNPDRRWMLFVEQEGETWHWPERA